ncbi:50S ribosomal protein L9 [Acholeplasma equirhinis]|uniref:50S ribosomal protein L9 n=1 Tax=Acholeplasma equirhinis TaxID=555393 RepID=UPI00197A9D5E|nr:50S ribosomal protein L9 [Acholeplasma equirhinis]MBN3490857.1 50S ribosomal protein L9 [Acholeplasma equirhinis]
MKRFLVVFISILIFIGSFAFLAILIYQDLQGSVDELMMIAFGLAFVSAIIFNVASLILSRIKYKNQITNLQNRLARWSKLSPRVNQIGDDAFQGLPIGIIVLDEELTEVKWVNNFAKEIFGTKLIDKNLGEINTALEDYIKSGSQDRITIAVNNDKYEVNYKKDLQVIYLFNVTERENVKLEFIKNLPAIGIINLDNFEENISNFDISEQSSIKGEYLSTIADWVEEYNGYLKPYGDNRLIMLTKRKKLEEMMANKFDILERIRSISSKYQIRVTVSIGIASWDLEYDELSDYAQNAIELAEKRGGDQAVVNIQNQKIAYFGAKQETTAKASRVNVRQSALELRDILDKTETLFIQGHNQTDLDSFGSMIATLKMALTAPDITPYLVVDEEKLDPSTSYVLSILKQNNHPILKYLISTEKALEKANEDTFMLIVDTQNPGIVHSPELLQKGMKLGVIDHHRGNEESIEGEYSFVDSSASSTIELIIELINFFNREISIDPLEASIMYGGLVVDTNTFTYRTTARTFDVAARLKDFGADSILVKTWLRNDLNKTVELNNLFASVEIFLDRFAIVKSEKIYHDRAFIAQVSQALLDIKNIDAAFAIVKIDMNTVGISARSFGAVNVQVIMEQMGGGGHLNSAATQMKDVKVNDAYLQLKNIIELEHGGTTEPMKVILLEDVKGKGKKDQIIEVAGGYANYLITAKQAMPATDENLKKLSEQKEIERQQEIKYLNLMKKIASEIEGKSVTLSLAVGADGKRFGSITSKQIVEEFERKHGVVIDKKKIDLATDITSAGIYPVTVHLDKGVKASFEVNIIEKRD